ncbi:hypothetical protein DFA_09642 [Cavenderia fasciculata]|uniref:ComC supersandwich domain-containing protein n=1 Tax=Cavenderia fasciculata TaxID=261658 RepID=F4Q871_CACFS|nr:uncharacterized protein DFA_09642 [Cavenderia fasciculata]EGG15971.1 hypothetical protein DFA_09642 [Cavenderia fasciculata]|eukprot:XP_004352296.1 hypothetical protein DFA_09642 [Cavenderia fasciculata]
MKINNNNRHPSALGGVCLSSIFVTVFIIILSLCVVSVSSQALPQNELDSAIWLIRQMGITEILQDQVSMCSSGQISCSNVQGIGYRIVSMITSLTFPYATSMSINFGAGYKSNIPTSTLSMLSGSFPLLQYLSIKSDITITTIPPTFGSNLVTLKHFVLQNCPNLIEVSSFGAMPLATTFSLHQSSFLKRLMWDQIQQQSYPIKDLQIEMAPESDQSFDITMPLTNFYFVDYSVSKTTKINLKSQFIDLIAIQGNVIINISHTKKLTYLSQYFNTSVVPSEISAYPLLKHYVRRQAPGQVIYPFTDYSLTPNLESIAIVQSNIVGNFPSSPFPSSLKAISFNSNNFTGVLPLEPFLTATPGLWMDLVYNPFMTGSLTPNFCSFYAFVANTGITQVPDCFYCYYGANIGFSSSIPPPAGFHCDIQFDKEIFPSIKGEVLITGKNLGWEPGSNYTMVIPNTKISFPFTQKGVPQTVGFNFSGKYYLETKVVVADIKASGLSFDNALMSISSPIISYPLISSAQLSGATLQSLTLNGNFGNNTFNSPSVTLNNTLACQVTSKNQTTIICTISSSSSSSQLPPGQASVQVQVDGFNTNLNNAISIAFPPSIDLKQKCIEDTLNCYGHGQCSDQGICVCDQNYYDNCRYFKNPNVTFVQNDTKPVATFELDGYKFFFSLVAIQELDVDDNVVQELIVDQWNVTDQSGDDLTSLHYRLLINSTLYPTLSSIVNVTSLIEYSTQDRQLPFGDSIVSVGANSIKVGVNVTGWQYQSILSHLRVVFSTIVNNEQSTIESCSSSDIPTFEQILGSDSYLRVIKNDTQFYGRFLSYSYSDGRKTFSRNELINQTNIIGNNNNESLALIGVHVPQCTFCLLDPDFSALVVNKEQQSDCSPSSSNTWKIIVGCVVGGAVFIALVIALAFYIRDSNTARFKLKAAKSILMKKVNKDV